MKKCPFCAEEIQDEAIICKHCHSDLKKMDQQRWDNPIKALVRNVISEKISGKLKGKNLNYEIDFNVAKYSWYRTRKMFGGKVAEGFEEGCIRDCFLFCTELNYVLSVEGLICPENVQLEEFSTMIIKSKLGDLYDLVKLSQENLTSGTLIRVRGKHEKNSTEFTERTLLVNIINSGKFAFVITQGGPSNKGDYAYIEFKNLCLTLNTKE